MRNQPLRSKEGVPRFSNVNAAAEDRVAGTRAGTKTPPPMLNDRLGDRREGLESVNNVLDCLPAQIVILDENGRIVLTNLAWKAFASNGKVDWRSVSEGVNYLAICDQATGAHAEEAQRVAEGIRRLIQGEMVDFQVKYECSTSQGRHWFLCRGRPFQEDGRKRVILIHSDVTEYEQKRLELERVQNELARACRLATMGEMAAGIAHELKQPLCAIGLYLETCLEMFKQETPPIDELLSKIELTLTLNGKCSQIIDGLRALVENQPAPRHEIFDLSATVRTVVAIVQQECGAAGIDLRLRTSPEPIWISGVVVQIQQVLLNLIRNAIEAHQESGSVEKRVDIDITSDERDATFAIRDYGTGIADEIRGRLFEPFFTTKPKGIGMGLRISQAIMRAHGGRFTCDHTVDPGTSFQFYLPTAQRVIDD